MPRTLEDLIAHGEELAAEFETYEPDSFGPPSAESMLAHAAMQRAAAERRLREIVVEARGEGLSWPVIGKILGVSGEAARKRYGRAVEETSAVVPNQGSERSQVEAPQDAAHDSFAVVAVGKSQEEAIRAALGLIRRSDRGEMRTKLRSAAHGRSTKYRKSSEGQGFTKKS